MKLPRIAIENSSFTWMAIIFLTILGVRSLLFMPKTENPEVSIPGSSIIVIMPGASPVDMERMIALPIEEAINELEDIDRISTSVRDGIVVVSVEFDFNTDSDEKFDEVMQQMNGIRSSLPEEIKQLEMFQWTLADMAMIQLALISDSAPWSDLQREADKIQDKVNKIQGISKMQMYGLPEREIQIRLDFEKMAMVNTSIEQVSNAIKSNNINIPGGDVKIGAQSLRVISSGSYQDLDEIRNTVVNAQKGSLIYLKNIASVEYGYEDLKHMTRYGSKWSGVKEGGRRCIFLGISQKEGLNVLETSEELMPVIEEIEKDLPQEMRVEIVYNQSVRVKNRINGFLNNLLQGIVLVGVFIFIFLGFRSSIVVVIAIPLSLIIGIGFVDLAGFGLQQISIAGLVVALGMLVDNSIVMVENINRFLEMGHNRKEASILAASEIGWPVIAATVTTILAFIPLAAMPYMAGDFIKSLPVTIMITLTVSLMIALTLTPAITSRLFRERDMKSMKTRGGNRALKWIIEKSFRTSLKKALKYPVLVLLAAFIFLLGSLWMFQYVGVSFFPKSEQANVMIQAKLPEGANIQSTDKVARYIEQVLDTTPEVRFYASNVGHGNPQIYYNVFPKRSDMTFAEVYVELYSYSPELFERVLMKLRKAMDVYPGARIRVKEFEQGPPVDAPIQIFLKGEDLEVLKDLSTEVEGFIREQPGAINIENQFVKTNTELLFDINKEKANMLGIPVIEIDRTIRTAVTGMGISKFRDKKGEEYQIILKMNHSDDFKIEDVDRIYVSSLSGKQIQLTQVVDIKLQQNLSTISRFNMERTAEVRADILSTYKLDDVIGPVLEKLEQFNMPPGYSYKIGGELESRTETFGGMTNAILIAVISIFSVLVLQFRSFRKPLIVFLAIPFAVTGMIWALWLTGNTFSFTAFIGLTSLVGIVVNNSIILVDYINKLRKKNMPLTEALQLAAETRLTPIVLTAVTTIGGLLPLTLRGGTLWAPLGWTIIGGLLVSTVLTLILVPVFYKLLEGRTEKI
jgi:multidrug efflux pump subunit AcrB